MEEDSIEPLHEHVHNGAAHERLRSDCRFVVVVAPTQDDADEVRGFYNRRTRHVDWFGLAGGRAV